MTTWSGSTHNRFPVGFSVVVGPTSPEQAHAVLRDLAGALAAWSAAQTEVDVMVDCGRLAPGVPDARVASWGRRVDGVDAPTVDQLRPAAHRVMALRDSGVDATLLLVGDPPYGADEVASTLDVRTWSVSLRGTLMLQQC